MNDLFLFLLGLFVIILIVGLVKPKLVVRWGDKEKRNRKSVLKYYGLGILVLFILASITMPSEDNKDEIADNNKEEIEEAKKDEVKEEEEVEEEVENEIKDNDLFNKVYYKIASRDQVHEKNAVIVYLEANDFIFDEDIELNSFKVEDDKTEDSDYVYIKFEEIEDEPDLELISSISYFLEDEELEVMFTNYSPKKEVKYDDLKTHKVGESDKKVNSLEEQIIFLKKTKNEHKANKDKVKEKASENKKNDPIELVLDVEETIEDGKVLFKINTNLPNNTTGSVALVNKNIDYTAQDGFEVKDGKSEAGPYSMKGEPLPSGTYKVSISTPLAQIQSDDVFIEIGEDYNNYIGDKFNDGDMGRNISYSFEINIP